MVSTSWLRWLQQAIARHRAGRFRRRKRGNRPWPFVPILNSLEDRSLPSVFTVSTLADSGAGSLRQAVLDADGDGGANQIVFAAGMQGSIALTSGQLDLTDDMTITGPGPNQIAVSGSGLSRVFDISGGPTVTIAGLTITGGVSPNHGGGGIFNETGATLTLRNVVVTANQAAGDADPTSAGGGGGLWNQDGAMATVIDSVFTGNQITALNSPNAAGEGGAIDNDGTMTVTGTTFSGNQAFGANDGHGGAIANDGTLSVTASTFTGNQGVGGSGGTNLGLASGGAIANFSELTVTGSIFTGNQALGGNGGVAGSSGYVGTAFGGAIYSNGELMVSDCTLSYNQALGGSGNHGSSAGASFVGWAAGGALLATGLTTSTTISNSTLSFNQALGGAGNFPGTGSINLVNTGTGGGIWNFSQLTVSNSTIVQNQAVGGAGSPGQAGGDARGGGFANAQNATGHGTLTLVNSTLAYNQALGGSGGLGGNGGNSWGGGLLDGGGPVTLINSTLAYNQALGGSGGPGGDGGDGLGGGLYTGATGQTTLMGSLIVNNQAVGGAAGPGGADGQGIGGGVYIVAGGMVCADATTLIRGNQASTSNDDVYGDLCMDAAPSKGSLRVEAVTRLFAIPGVVETILGDLGGP